jgi:hypothetical protein
MDGVIHKAKIKNAEEKIWDAQKGKSTSFEIIFNNNILCSYRDICYLNNSLCKFPVNSYET